MLDIPSIREKIHHFKKARVVCVGDIMLDKFTYGTVERISPEAPIPVLKVQQETLSLGGAGNVVNNLCTLGAQAICIGVIGKDFSGDIVKSLLSKMDVPLSTLVESDHLTTTVKNRFIAHHQQVLRADHEEEAHAYSGEILAALEKQALSALENCDALILSDYGKGVLTKPLLEKLIGRANELGIPTVVDPKGKKYGVYGGATVVTPNRKELADATHLPVHDDAHVEAAAQYLLDHCHIQNVLATRSEQGMSLVEQDGTVTHIPTFAQEVFDVSGAGDTVVATLAASLAIGISLREAACLANHAGGVVVAKIGTAPIHDYELLDALQDKQFESSRKIFTLVDALPLIKEWKAQGKKIGFTNGCFDLLHLGHLSSLQQARRNCDKLIVGLNSDASIKRLKGTSRPIQSELIRANVLGALENVSMVIVFDEDTPEALIKAITPHILFKGKDYTVDKIVGGPHVMANGGKVILLDLEEGYSTTRTVQKMQSPENNQ